MSKQNSKKTTVKPLVIVEKQRSLHTEHSSLISLLKGAKLDNPFEQLGLLANPAGKGFILRAWLPDAIDVELYALGSDKAMAKLSKIDDAGLFEIKLADTSEKFTYELNAIYKEAEHRDYDKIMDDHS